MKKSKVETVHPFIRARRAGAPIMTIESYDPAATIAECCRSLNGAEATTPLFVWTCNTGLTPVIGPDGKENLPAKAWLAQQDENWRAGTVAPSFPQMLIKDAPIYEDVPGAVFALNLHHWISDPTRSDPGTIQAIWNARDPFKSRGNTLVLIGCTTKLPPELKNDVPTFSEPIPDEEMIGQVIDETLTAAEISPAKIDRPKVIDGLLGYLSRFNVEQSLALSLSEKGVDLDQLWDLKVAALKHAAGLEITRPKETFKDLRGAAGSIDLLNKLIKGKYPPRCVLWLDEIEKMLAGGTGDQSGTSQAMIEQFLFWTEARHVHGILLIGIPGAGKSRTCQCTAGEAGIPLLRASMSTVKGSFVGQSEQQMKALLAAVDAVGQGRILMLATCNSLDNLSPEIMARFRIGTIFYDYPDRDEARSIWDYYLKKYELGAQPIPPSPNWVGREIASCCEKADLFNCTLADAAQSVVPVATANAGKMKALRESVDGRFLSASRPGIFTLESQTPAATGRKITV